MGPLTTAITRVKEIYSKPMEELWAITIAAAVKAARTTKPETLAEADYERIKELRKSSSMWNYRESLREMLGTTGRNARVITVDKLVQRMTARMGHDIDGALIEGETDAMVSERLMRAIRSNVTAKHRLGYWRNKEDDVLVWRNPRRPNTVQWQALANDDELASTRSAWAASHPELQVVARRMVDIRARYRACRGDGLDGSTKPVGKVQEGCSTERQELGKLGRDLLRVAALSYDIRRTIERAYERRHNPKHGLQQDQAAARQLTILMRLQGTILGTQECDTKGGGLYMQNKDTQKETSPTVTSQVTTLRYGLQSRSQESTATKGRDGPESSMSSRET